MKKIVLLFTFSLSLFAIDMSQNSNKDQSYKEDKTVGYNKSININKSKDISKDTTKSKEKSYTVSQDLTKIEQTAALIMLLALEKVGIEPFASCQVLSNPRLAGDFELSCDNGYSSINEGRCSFLQNAAISNFNIDEVTYMSDEIKTYAACVGLYGALIAQDMKRNKFSPILTDIELKETFLLFTENIAESDCKFNGASTSFVCGASFFDIGIKPNLVFSNISLYSDSAFYGYSSSINKSKSRKQSDTFSMSESKKRSKSNAMTKSINSNKSLSNSLSKASSANLSLSKLLPSE